MWFLYVPLVALILVAAGSAFVGFLPGVLGAIILGFVLIGLGLLDRARSVQLDKVESPGGIPSSEASYEPRSDPSSTPTGGSTAS